MSMSTVARRSCYGRLRAHIIIIIIIQCLYSASAQSKSFANVGPLACICFPQFLLLELLAHSPSQFRRCFKTLLAQALMQVESAAGLRVALHKYLQATSAAQCPFWPHVGCCVLLRGASFWSLGPVWLLCSEGSFRLWVHQHGMISPLSCVPC